jgi:putative transposase
MYDWRKMTEEERAEVLRIRKGRGLPRHSPPHLEFVGFVTFIITAACYEHAHIIGKTVERMAECEREILETCRKLNARVFAWCILPNHYHILVRTDDIKGLRKEIGQYHGRSARFWNVEDDAQGRKVWFNFFDREMKSNRHFWASINYIHHNAVKHGYVNKWQDWAFSSANNFLKKHGKEKALKIWNEYPILDYGKDWDIY